MVSFHILVSALPSILPLATAAGLSGPASIPSSQISPGPFCPPRPATIDEQRAVFANFTDLIFNRGNLTRAYLTYVAEDYIQHNPNILSGRQNSIDAVQAVIDAGATFDIFNTAFDRDWGYVFLRANFAGAEQPSAVVDIFRLNGSCIVEHWDVVQEKPKNATNPIAMWS